MSDRFRLIMISAMYENGGNTTHRLLDGHPELFAYPFESQLGTRLAVDHLASLYPAKYRWPVFDLEGQAADAYEAILDEECKVRLKTPQASKFRDTPIDLKDSERKEAFLRRVGEGRPTRARLVEAFFRATFDAWKDRVRSGREHTHVGYSPIVGVDGDTILRDFPEAHVLHVVRNPWSAYADTLKRPVPLSPAHYLTGWTVCQELALVHRERHPDRFHILRYEDIVRDPEAVLGSFCRSLGLESSATLAQPSWNGRPLAELRPWGTIRTPTPQANDATALELPDRLAREVRIRTAPFLGIFGYDKGPPFQDRG